MNQLQVISSNGRLVTESREVAKMTGKRHNNLVRDIESYVGVLSQNSKLSSDDFFIPGSYQAGTGKRYKLYYLTKKGCDMVANKMTGQKGILFTAEYVTRFEEMEHALTNQDKPSYMIDNPVERAEKWIVEHKERDRLEKENYELKPKATYYDLILQSKSLLAISVIAKDYGISGTEMNKILHELGIQYKQGGTWLLYQKHADKGYTHSKTQEYDGGAKTRMHTYWTQKGRRFIYETLKEQKDFLPIIERENQQLRLIQ